MSPMVSGDLLEQIAQARRRNKDLATKLAQCQKSRDKWKEKALERNRENVLLRRIIHRLRTPPKRPVPPRTYTAEQWRQHDLIVRRIRNL